MFEEPWTGRKAHVLCKDTLDSKPHWAAVSWSVKWDPDCTVSWKHTSRGFSVLLLIKTYPPQGLALSFSSWVFEHLWWVRCSWLHCPNGDIVLVLLAVRHPCTHSAVVWRNALVLMQTTRSECGHSILVAWCILELSSFILPRQLPFVQVCAFLMTVYRSQGKASYLHSILILAQTSRMDQSGEYGTCLSIDELGRRVSSPVDIIVWLSQVYSLSFRSLKTGSAVPVPPTGPFS